MARGGLPARARRTCLMGRTGGDVDPNSRVGSDWMLTGARRRYNALPWIKGDRKDAPTARPTCRMMLHP